MTYSQTANTNEFAFTVDLYDTVNKQVLAGSISYTVPLQDALPYVIGGTEANPDPGLDALVAGLKSFFENADYSGYGANVQFHTFHAERRTAAVADISPA